MRRQVKILAFLMLAAAVPATTQTLGLSLGGSVPQPCLVIGKASYWIAADRADITVRIDPDAATPDIRIALVEHAEKADFVFVDDGAPAACPRGPVRTVTIDPEAAAAVVVGFAAADLPADYRIYVRSRSLETQSAAALFAAAHVSPRRLAGGTAHRSN